MKRIRNHLHKSVITLGFLFVSQLANAQIPPPENPEDMLSKVDTGTRVHIADLVYAVIA